MTKETAAAMLDTADALHEAGVKRAGKLVAALWPIARRMHNRDVYACNVGLEDRHERAEERDRTKIDKLLADAAVPIQVKYNGDPRGYPVKLILPTGRYNSFGGAEEGWGIG